MSLSKRERVILEAAAETLLPSTDRLPDTAESLRIPDRVGHHLECLSAPVRVLFRVTLWMIQAWGLITRGRPFTRMAPDRREAALEGWRSSRFYLRRLLYRLVESIIVLNYYSHPEVNRRIGFAPSPIRHRADPPPHNRPVGRDLFLKTEVCVIGSGAGGGVVARELAERGIDVVILEEGDYATINDFGREPLEVVQRLYRSAGLQATIGLPSILVPTGRAVGGTTIINSGTCFRLPDAVIDRWRTDFGLTDLTPEVLSPYFERVEERLHVIPVEEAVLGKNAGLFRTGLEKLGLKGEPLMRDVRDCRGAGICCFGCPNDAKQSIHLSYIPQAILKGARLYTGARVIDIFPKLNHGGEVLAVADGHEIRVDARVVVLAAGTLITPQLLRRNHIALSNRNIGRNLSIHPACKVSGLFDEEVRGWEGVPQGYAYHGMANEGVLFEGVFTPPSFGGININLPPRLHKEVMGLYSHIAAFGFMVTDQARGFVRSLPNGDPLIFYNLPRRQVPRFAKAIRFLSEVLFAAGARKIFTGIRCCPVLEAGEGTKPLDRITLHRTDLDLAAFHPLGTCRMGPDPATSVVNSFGEVHGVKNLFIADGSIFPTPLGVNPQETIMAFATRTAEHIVERLSRGIPVPVTAK